MPTLDATSLSRDERALLERFADRLDERWGDRLYARSTEFLDAAHRRLASARRAMAVDPASVVRADYEAWPASDADAQAIVDLAERFIAAVEAMFA